jgi:hypothetical protein
VITSVRGMLVTPKNSCSSVDNLLPNADFLFLLGLYQGQAARLSNHFMLLKTLSCVRYALKDKQKEGDEKGLLLHFLLFKFISVIIFVISIISSLWLIILIDIFVLLLLLLEEVCLYLQLMKLPSIRQFVCGIDIQGWPKLQVYFVSCKLDAGIALSTGACTS